MAVYYKETLVCTGLYMYTVQYDGLRKHNYFQIPDRLYLPSVIIQVLTLKVALMFSGILCVNLETIARCL